MLARLFCVPYKTIGRPAIIYGLANPSFVELFEFINSTNYKTVKGIYNYKKRLLYIWDADKASHYDIATGMGLFKGLGGCIKDRVTIELNEQTGKLEFEYDDGALRSVFLSRLIIESNGDLKYVCQKYPLDDDYYT